jgi:hypothetical protein
LAVVPFREINADRRGRLNLAPLGRGTTEQLDFTVSPGSAAARPKTPGHETVSWHASETITKYVSSPLLRATSEAPSNPFSRVTSIYPMDWKTADRSFLRDEPLSAGIVKDQYDQGAEKEIHRGNLRED